MGGAHGAGVSGGTPLGGQFRRSWADLEEGARSVSLGLARVRASPSNSRPFCSPMTPMTMTMTAASCQCTRLVLCLRLLFLLILCSACSHSRRCISQPGGHMLYLMQAFVKKKWRCSRRVCQRRRQRHCRPAFLASRPLSAGAVIVAVGTPTTAPEQRQCLRLWWQRWQVALWQ